MSYLISLISTPSSHSTVFVQYRCVYPFVRLTDSLMSAFNFQHRPLVNTISTPAPRQRHLNTSLSSTPSRRPLQEEIMGQGFGTTVKGNCEGGGAFFSFFFFSM